MTEKVMGRPTKYSKALADQIVELYRNGDSLRKICERPEMPCRATLHLWQDKHPDFLDRLQRAREESAEIYNDMEIEVADDLKKAIRSAFKNSIDMPLGTAQACDALMKCYRHQAAMRDDSKFGDRKKLKAELTGKDGSPLTTFVFVDDLKDS